jgi:hypothetical protein
MVKTATSASIMMDQLILSLAWAHLTPEVKYYSGSFAKSSKFTTRIFVSFDNQTSPKNQIILHTHRLFPSGKSPAKKIREQFIFELKHDLFSYELNPEVRATMRLLSQSNPILKDFHKIVHYQIVNRNNNRICGYILDHNSPERFTGGDVFQYCWVFVSDMSVSLKELSEELRFDSRFSKKVIQLVLGDGTSSPPEAIGDTDNEVPAFWTFTPNVELGPIIGSICKSVYTVLKKYGEDAMVEMVKLL